MSKQDQVLKIDPAFELHFKGPFTEVVSSTIKLHNPTDNNVCFKVKTTAPKKYCVRPNSGTVPPQGTVPVSVMLQPHDFDPKEKSKHKFMVQSMIVAGSPENLDNIWKEASPEQIMDSKLKCVFDMPEEHSVIKADPVQSSESKDVNSSVESGLSKSLPQSNVSKEAPQEGEKLKAEVKPSTQTTPTTDDKTMKAEILRLKEENERLKNEVRQRPAGMKPNTSSSAEVAQALHLANSESESQFPPIVYLIVALIFGIIIGKILL